MKADLICDLGFKKTWIVVVKAHTKREEAKTSQFY
jgi:hypothetical protein